MSIKRMVDDYLPKDAPPALRKAMAELTAAIRGIATDNEICAVCLTFAVADMIDLATDDGKISHEPGEEDEDTAQAAPTGVTIQ